MCSSSPSTSRASCRFAAWAAFRSFSFSKCHPYDENAFQSEFTVANQPFSYVLSLFIEKMNPLT
jgi:hypothetical protein